MRCPQCQERNSVAARKCNFCGERFKAKPVSNTAKLAISGLCLIGGGAVIASVVMPCLSDPGQTLKNSAKRMAAGPKSVEDANAIKEDFTQTIKNYLTSSGHLPAADLTKKLQEILPVNSYEVHVSELPRGLKLVEVDALLQGHTFLVMKGTNNNIKVFPLPQLEVFDEARILNDSAGPMLALLGHTGGQMPHRPQLRILALLPDNVLDETDKLVPPVVGDGTARFEKGHQNVQLELSMASLFRGLNTSFPVVERDDHNVKMRLVWKDARYQLVTDSARTPALTLFDLMRVARRPDTVATANGKLGATGVKFVKESKLAGNTAATITKLPPAGEVFKYKVSSAGNGYAVSVEHKGSDWNIVAINSLTEKDKKDSAIAEVAMVQPAPAPDQHLSTSAVPPAAAASLTPVPVVTVAPPVHATHQSGSWVVSSTNNHGATTVSTTSHGSTSSSTGSGSSSSSGGKSSATQSSVAHSTAGSHGNNSGSSTSSGSHATIVTASSLNGSATRGGASSAATSNSPNSSHALSHTTSAGSAGKSSGTVTHVATNANTPASSSSASGRRAQVATNINVDSVRLRRSPSVNSSALAEIVTGSPIEVLGKEADWYKVRWNGQEGYIYGPLVDTGNGGGGSSSGSGGSSTGSSRGSSHTSSAPMVAHSSRSERNRSERSSGSRRHRRHSNNDEIVGRSSSSESSSRRSSSSNSNRRVRIASRHIDSSSSSADGPPQLVP